MSGDGRGAHGRFAKGHKISSKYDPEHCVTVVALGRLGKSPCQIAAAMDVSRSTIDLWAEKYVPFQEALECARDLAQAWWEDLGQSGARCAVEINPAVWRKTMEARFREDYTERRETVVSGRLDSKIDMTELSDEQLAALAAIKTE